MRRGIWVVLGVLLILGSLCRAQDITIGDPRAKQVETQQKENKDAQDAAAKLEADLLNVGNQCFQDKDFRQAAEYFQKALDITFDLWEFRVIQVGSVRSLQPADHKVRCKLSTSNTRAARNRLRLISGAVQAEEETAAQGKLKALFEQADVAIMLGNPAKAYLIYEDIVRAVAPMGEKKFAVQNAIKARDEQKKILASAAKPLDEAEKAMADGKLADALAKLESFKEEFAPLMVVAPDLKRRFDQLKTAPEIQQESKEQEVKKKTEMGDAALLREDYVIAARYYRAAATMYPETAASATAAGKLTQLLANQKATEALKQDEVEATCRSLISHAEGLVQAKKFDEAKSDCQKVIAQFPDTTWAKQAKEILQNCEQQAEKPADNP